MIMIIEITRVALENTILYIYTNISPTLLVSFPFVCVSVL